MPIKEVILSLNNARPEASKFVLEDLDETRLFVKASCLEWLREELDKFQNKNTYEVKPNPCSMVIMPAYLVPIDSVDCSTTPSGIQGGGVKLGASAMMQPPRREDGI